MRSIDEQLQDLHKHNVDQDVRAGELLERVAKMEAIIQLLFPQSSEAILKNMSGIKQSMPVSVPTSVDTKWGGHQ